MISTLGYWILESIEGIKKNRKTFFIGLGTMIVVLFIIGSLYILKINANSFMGDIKEDESKVSIFVKDLDKDTVTTVWSKLSEIEGVSNVEYIDEQQTIEKAAEKVPADFADRATLESANLPTSFIITIDKLPEEGSSKIIQDIYNIGELGDSIEEITGFDMAQKTVKIAKSVEIVSLTILILVTVTGCFLMMNSIKLALYARRKEISIMKYVGATDTFTRAPFIIEGLIIALLAAGITLLITSVVYTGVENFSSNTPLLSFVVSKDTVFSSLSILLLLVSIGIGTIGSAMSINKYLDV